MIRRFKAMGGVPAGTLLLALAGGAASSSRAEVTLAVVPPFVEKVVRPGSRVRDTLSFTNKGDEPVIVSVDFADFAVDEAGQVAAAPPGSQASSLVPNIRISPMEVRVAPAQEVFFRYAVETPEDFEQIRAMVFLSSRPETPPGPNRVMLVARMGVPIYVESAKAEPARLEVEDVRWEREEGAPERLRLSFVTTNEGRRNIRPTGFLHVRAPGEDFEQTFELNPGREPVLPGQKRRWEQSIGPVATGELAVKLRLTTSHRHASEAEGTVAAATP